MNNDTVSAAPKDFMLLKFLDRIKWIYEKSNIDYGIMRKILRIKLIMDQRRPHAAFASKKEEKETNSSFNLFYAFFGLIIGLFIFLPYPVFVTMNIVIGMIMFMIITNMIADYSSVLLDLRDKNIILPRPVDSKTLNAAKLTHILYYLFTLNVCIAGPSVIFAAIKYGAVFLVGYLLLILFISAFVVFFTSLLYYIILDFFDGEKLKDIINYFQIILTVFITVAYQFIGRIFDFVNINVTYTPKLWHLLMPTTWFAAPLCILVEKKITLDMLAFSAAGLIIPVATLILYVKKVAPSFEKKLLKLNTHLSKNEKDNRHKPIYRNPIGRLVCRDKMEFTFYSFIKRIVANERKLKLKLYPTLALAAIMPLIFILSQTRRVKLSEVLVMLSNGEYFLYLYLSSMILTGCYNLFTCSEKFKGAWIYRALPLESPVIPMKAGFKVFFLKFILPVLLVSCIPFIFIYKISLLKHIVIIVLNTLLACIIYFNLGKKGLPLSVDFSNLQSGSSGATFFYSLFVYGVMAGLHFVAGFITYGYLIYGAAIMILIAVVWKTSFKFKWMDMSL